MKTTLKIFILLLCVSCSSSSDNANNEKTHKTENKVQYFDLPKSYLGIWVYEEYYNSLVQTKSTKKTGEMGVDDFYKIYGTNSIMRLNIHEGGADNILLMTSENKGQIFSSDTSEAYFEIEFQNNLLLVDNKKYLKAPGHENGLNEFVNGAFLSGQYYIGDKTIEIKQSGEIIGLDSISTCELNLDYNDAGMQYDKIYLHFNNEKEARTYLYEYADDTLIIREIDCITQAEDYDYCLEVAKGQVVYKMIIK